METVQKLAKLLQAKPDIRVEVVIADLLEQNHTPEDFLIKNNGLFKRNYSSDIEDVELQELKDAGLKKILFNVNRPGLYDHLPEDLFHRTSNAHGTIDREKIIQDIKVQAETELNARLFFLPLEQEFYYERIKLELEERSFLSWPHGILSGNIFSSLWNMPDFLTEFQKSNLRMIMPIIYRFGGDLKFLQFIFRNLTGITMEIDETDPFMFALTEQPYLHVSRLGVDFILGGEIMEMQTSLKVRIVPESLEDDVPYANTLKLCRFLCDLVLPFEAEYQIDLDLSKISPSFIIEDKCLYQGMLNNSTII